MKIPGDWLRRQIVSSLVMVLAVPFGEAAVARAQQALPDQQTQGASSLQARSQNSGTGNGKPAGNTNPSEVSPNNPNSTSSPTLDRNRPSATTPDTSNQQKNDTSKAVGTAAAPYEKQLGVPASRPAGAAIAPAKQKRAFSILIKVGIILGAAVAIGTVAALSRSSPSRPH